MREELFLEVFRDPALDNDMIAVVLTRNTGLAKGELSFPEKIWLLRPNPTVSCKPRGFRGAGACGGSKPVST
jgi:hypothetical protein